MDDIKVEERKESNRFQSSGGTWNYKYAIKNTVDV